MRLYLKILSIIAGIIVFVFISIWAWVYISPIGIPDIACLQTLAPATRTQVNQPGCGTPASVTAVPAFEMARFRDALVAAEGDPKNTAAFRDALGYLLFKQRPQARAHYSLALAGSLLFPSKPIHYQIKRLRTASQIERRFRPDDILTIYANSAYFGNETYGVENASQRYFKKKALQLSVGEDAFLAGLIQNPSRFLKHPDKATERRNAVLDRMTALQMISAAEAEKAKGQPLGIAE
jgi:transglycosylase-like protein